MPQIGSPDKPVTFKSGTIAGKGSKARPGVYTKEYRDNFDRIFGHAKVTIQNQLCVRGFSRKSKPVLKVVNPDSGRLGKPSF
jgi:hypothetical protein